MVNIVYIFFSYAYRFFERLLLKRKGVYIAYTARFSPKTTFGGWNKIHAHTVVSGSEIGRYTFVGENCYLPQSLIGSFCSIGDRVRVVAETHPSRGFLSTSPVFYSLNQPCRKTFADKQYFVERLFVKDSCFRTIIGNDVWIGNGASILGGGNRS